MSRSYSRSVAPVSSLYASVRQRMADLYLACYDGSNKALFFHDLAGKDEAVLVHCQGVLVGFTTLRLHQFLWRGRPVRVLYSGDTVMDPAHWGQQALAFAVIERMGALRREHPDVPLYWLLLVKGHRTFRYLPVFSRSFYPHWAIDRSDLKPLTDTLAMEFFGADYNARTGVVEFARSRGHLKPALAWPAARELDCEGVRFFLQRNPGFVRGHELVCLCELEDSNLKPLPRRLFLRGAHAG